MTDILPSVAAAFVAGENAAEAAAIAATNEYFTSAIQRLVGAPAGLPALSWTVSKTGSRICVNGYASRVYSEEEIKDILPRWADKLGLRVSRPPSHGTTHYKGIVDDKLDITIWGITDRQAFDQAAARMRHRRTGGTT